MHRKDTVAFSCGALDERYPQVLTVTPSVNGVPLPQLVSQFEERKDYEPAGGYGGIVPKWFDCGPLENYLLGQFGQDSYWAKLGNAYILGCECGEVGCWPLECRIRAEDNDVIWDQFRQPHRNERNYSDFGPFIFDRAQYRDAICRLMAEISGG